MSGDTIQETNIRCHKCDWKIWFKEICEYRDMKCENCNEINDTELFCTILPIKRMENLKQKIRECFKYSFEHKHLGETEKTIKQVVMEVLELIEELEKENE